MAFVEGFKKFMGMAPIEDEDFFDDESEETVKSDFTIKTEKEEKEEPKKFDTFEEKFEEKEEFEFEKEHVNNVIFTDNFNTKKENEVTMTNMNNLNGLNGLGDYDNNSYHSSMFSDTNEQPKEAPQPQPQVVLVQPERFEDASSIADNMLAKKTIVINTDSLSQDVRRRMVDFLSGVAYADGATIKKASNTTFVMTPDTVGIVGEGLAADDEPANSSAKANEEQDEKYY